MEGQFKFLCFKKFYIFLYAHEYYQFNINKYFHDEKRTCVNVLPARSFSFLVNTIFGLQNVLSVFFFWQKEEDIIKQQNMFLQHEKTKHLTGLNYIAVLQKHLNFCIKMNKAGFLVQVNKLYLWLLLFPFSLWL